MILLVTRLVIGEFAHAHDAAHTGHDTAAAQESAQCHGTAGGAEVPDCCKTGGCECPCVFAVPIGFAASFVLVPVTELRIDASASAVGLVQPFELFRPPAALPLFA